MAKKKEQFEDLMERLEQVVARLESGELRLDESIGLFREGVGLVKASHERLAELEGKVELLCAEDGKGESLRPLTAQELEPLAQAADDDEPDEDEVL